MKLNHQSTGRVALFILLIYMSLGHVSPLAGPDDTFSLDMQLNALTEQIVSNMTDQNKSTIAVVEFSDLDGNVSELGQFLSEELITRLFMTRRFEVIERHLLNKVISEHELNMTGLVDVSSAKTIGKILGVDAIVTGSVTDLGENIKVNARLISTA